MSNRACLSCGMILSSLKKGRCVECAKEKQAEKPNPYRQSKGAREWRNLSARKRKEQPWCSRCATQGDASNPLTLDHIVPLSKGGALIPEDIDEGVQVLCKRCQGIVGSRMHKAGQWRA